MNYSFEFIFTSVMLGIGLAMDAFSVSLANGLNEPCMKKKKIVTIAFVFAAFQAIMPLIGWFCVHTIADKFAAFRPFIPWIALILLAYIGGNMLLDGLKKKEEDVCAGKLGICSLLLQGIATSIDALSVGFTISEYNYIMALTSALIIAAVTFVICLAGVIMGRYCGTVYSSKSSVLGGLILIFIGIEIFVTGVF